VKILREVLHNSQRVQNMGLRAREVAVSYDRAKQLRIFAEALEEVVSE
jgi:hypothetical protein